MSASHATGTRRPVAITIIGTALAVTLAASLAGCGPDSTPPALPLASPVGGDQPINRSNLGHLWPLTTDSGTLTCRNRQDALFLSGEGTAYALNEQAHNDGYPSIDAITSPDAHLGALRSLAVKLCEKNTE